AALHDEQWTERYKQLGWQNFKLNRLNTEIWRRWANGFSCLAFVLVGAGLAILLRTADIWTSFGLCFLPILIVYYPIMQFGVDRAKIGELPVYSVWIGNLVLFFFAALFLRKVNRY
ncbi:MAG: LptF/LptG family permease, partial [Pirellulaceae bacterium]